MNQLMQVVMKNRKYAPDYFDLINTEPHREPMHTDKLCEVLKKHHDEGNTVVLLTDFDTDGISAGVLGFAGLAELGFRVVLFRPLVTEGYGFGEQTIRRIMEDYPDAKCLLTADTGISCLQGVSYARSIGLDVLVTDHHLAQVEVDATVAVDPARKFDSSAFSGTCGACVLYQVLLFYAKRYGTAFQTAQIRRLCVFAGFGTVSDGMPVHYENRRLILDCLEIMKMIYNDGDSSITSSILGTPQYQRAFYGLFMLLKGLEEHGNSTMRSRPLDIHEDFLAFYIAPMFNSIKRMDGRLEMAYDIFFGPDPAASVKELIELNEQRKDLVAKYTERLLENMDPQPWAPYIYLTEASSGIRGLLAQSMLTEHGHPVMVVGLNPDGSYSGSGRCPEWYPFLDMAVSEYWVAEGHNPAFGISFDDENGLDELVRFLEKSIPSVQPSEEEMQTVPDFTISMLDDGDLPLDVELVMEYLDEQHVLRPFGAGFPEPEGVLRLQTSAVEFTFMGKEKQHVRMTLPMGIQVILWNVADVLRPHLMYMPASTTDEGPMYPYYISVDLPEILELVGRWQYNNYNDNRSVQFIGHLLTDVAE